jgi:hypothetical protein
LSSPFVSSAVTFSGAPQCSPPSVDLLTMIALWVSKTSNVSDSE